MVAVMDRLGVLERDACDAMPEGAWKDECLFRYAERVAAAGDVAAGAAACTQVRYARECSFHLVRNSARTVLERPVAQAAPALEPWRTALAAAPGRAGTTADVPYTPKTGTAALAAATAAATGAVVI